MIRQPARTSIYSSSTTPTIVPILHMLEMEVAIRKSLRCPLPIYLPDKAITLFVLFRSSAPLKRTQPRSLWRLHRSLHRLLRLSPALPHATTTMHRRRVLGKQRENQQLVTTTRVIVRCLFRADRRCGLHFPKTYNQQDQFPRLVMRIGMTFRTFLPARSHSIQFSTPTREPIELSFHS